MLDLGIKKLEKFSLPEEIVGERVVLVPRRHEFDEALFELIHPGIFCGNICFGWMTPEALTMFGR